MIKVPGTTRLMPGKLMKTIKNIAVIGEGKMGSSIFFWLNGYDFNLTWLCSNKSGMESSFRAFEKKTRHFLHSAVITESELLSKLASTRITIDPVDLKNCDLVIEAITENLTEKRKLFKLIANIAGEDCLLVSNSSSLLPSDLFQKKCGIERFAGLHFFFPVSLKSTVELITGTSTSDETRERLHNFLIQTGKRPFSQDESDPFILNRIILDFQAEAFNIISDGEISFSGLDELVKKYIFPTGVFQFFDHVGIDTMLSSIESYMRFVTEREFYQPMIIRLREMVALNHLGIKTRKGFYNYKDTSFFQDNKLQIDTVSEYQRIKIISRLWNYYEKSFLSVLGSGICTRGELEIHLQDYLGLDRDPFTLIKI
jgi:3-hydroxybutyryl-CoA dehydrogenase